MVSTSGSRHLFFWSRPLTLDRRGGRSANGTVRTLPSRLLARNSPPICQNKSSAALDSALQECTPELTNHDDWAEWDRSISPFAPSRRKFFWKRSPPALREYFSISVSCVKPACLSTPCSAAPTTPLKCRAADPRPEHCRTHGADKSRLCHPWRCIDMDREHAKDHEHPLRPPRCLGSASASPLLMNPLLAGFENAGALSTCRPSVCRLDGTAYMVARLMLCPRRPTVGQT